jgi:uncharacterized membrane protein
VVVVAVVVALAIGQQPAPALTGSGLAVLLSLALLCAATVALVREPEAAIELAALGAMILGSATLVWLQPGGAGAAGLFVAKRHVPSIGPGCADAARVTCEM